MAVLACLVKTYLSHSKFADMYQLLNDDPEQDFFENVKHIQVQMRKPWSQIVIPIFVQYSSIVGHGLFVTCQNFVQLNHSANQP